MAIVDLDDEFINLFYNITGTTKVPKNIDLNTLKEQLINILDLCQELKEASGNKKALFKYNNKDIYRYTEKENLQSLYARETEKLESWKEFCANGNLKLLKDIKGNAWIVQIIDSPRSSIELNSNIYQTTINFSWQEMENVSDYSIIDVLN